MKKVTFEVWFDVTGADRAEIDGIYVDVDYDENDGSGKAWTAAETAGAEKMDRISAFMGWDWEVSGCDFAMDEDDDEGAVRYAYKAVLTDEDGFQYNMFTHISRELAEMICRRGGIGWAIVRDGVIL